MLGGGKPYCPPVGIGSSLRNNITILPYIIKRPRAIKLGTLKYLPDLIAYGLFIFIESQRSRNNISQSNLFLLRQEFYMRKEK